MSRNQSSTINESMRREAASLGINTQLPDWRDLCALMILCPHDAWHVRNNVSMGWVLHPQLIDVTLLPWSHSKLAPIPRRMR